MDIVIRPFEAADYAEVRSLWEVTVGVGLSSADEKSSIHAFLERNPGLSFVAVENGCIVGTILVGHDGRRGLIHHLSISISHRQKKLGQRLVHEGLTALRRAGIQKCHLLVFDTNLGGRAFWEAIGAKRRGELLLYSLPV